jgi:aldose 1-epimerase
MGFPGSVSAFITYGVTASRWHIYINATSTAQTPLMLTSHVYWNLDAFENPYTSTALNHTLELPFSGQRIDVDSILVPTGIILPNTRGGVNDFWTSPKQIGASFDDPALNGNCGAGCRGYDNCYLVNREQWGSTYFQPLADGSPWYEADPVATMWSDWSGIQVNIFSDQDAFQVYSCNGQDS